ncbi:unnamed protein product [Caenorhabditis auriculariae]|uniref:Major sperm protein n=1 Tax=Caenorhabditis auriculariae TaxID=2777116 RepID=A0A8S1HHV6_9PELO|nr:unnamed protein product [Caenorhabditis auriculariae]
MADKKGTEANTSTGVAIVDAGPSEIANKPGEPAFKLALSTKQIVFPCPIERKPVSVAIKIYNGSNDPQTFKVKCTSAEVFRVQPPLGVIKPNSTQEIVLWFQNKMRLEAPKHYFAFYHMKADNRTPKEMWANAKAEGVRRVPAIFEGPGAAPVAPSTISALKKQ